MLFDKDVDDGVRWGANLKHEPHKVGTVETGGYRIL